MTGEVSRAEFEQLQRRVEAIDTGGTSGMSVLAFQVQELAKDLAKHELIHADERQARAAARRWMLATVVAIVAAVDGPIVSVLLATRGGH